MKKLRLALSSTIAAAGILALSGVAVPQSRSDSVEVVVSNCPQPKFTSKKISEDEAQDLAQRYADKNFKDFKVIRSGGTSRYGRAAAHGGGYPTVCYRAAKPTIRWNIPSTRKIQKVTRTSFASISLVT